MQVWQGAGKSPECEFVGFTCPSRPLLRPALLTSMQGKPAASISVSCTMTNLVFLSVREFEVAGSSQTIVQDNCQVMSWFVSFPGEERRQSTRPEPTVFQETYS